MELASGVASSSAHSLSEGVACLRLSENGASHGITSSYRAFLSRGESVSQARSCAWRLAGGDPTTSACAEPSSRSRSFSSGRPRYRTSVHHTEAHRVGKLGRGLVTEGCTQRCESALANGGTSGLDSRLLSNLDREMYSQNFSSKGLLCYQRSFSKHIFGRPRRKTGICGQSIRPGSSGGYYELGVSRVSGNKDSKLQPGGQTSLPVCWRYKVPLENLKGPVAFSGHGGGKNRRSSSECGSLSRSWKGVVLSTRKRWMATGRASLRKEVKRTVRVSATRSESVLSNTSLSPDANSAPYEVKDGDTLTSIAKKSKTTVRLLADANSIEDVNFLLSGQLLFIPTQSETDNRGDEFPFARNFDSRASSSNGVSWQEDFPDVSEVRGASQGKEGHHLAASVRLAPGFNFPKLAVPILLIAPLLGFCIRCVVDALYIHMDREEAKLQVEREAWEILHRPKAKRWQRILEEDRDDTESPLPSVEGSTARNPWTGGDVWTQDVNVREKTRENIKSETDEEIGLRHKQDYEDIRKSYAELESSYVKFLADSGMSKSGYWRGSGVPTSARLDDGEPR